MVNKLEELFVAQRVGQQIHTHFEQLSVFHFRVNFLIMLLSNLKPEKLPPRVLLIGPSVAQLASVMRFLRLPFQISFRSVDSHFMPCFMCTLHGIN
jgi:hypothetical protein